MQEEAPVAAVHQAKAEPDEPACSIAQIVIDPVALGEISRSEERGRDLELRGAVEFSIECPEGEDEAIGGLGGECARIGCYSAWKIDPC
ncbi:hypothetical protein GCM10011611_66350 [Aliidongia dinghuensis]|uniref:Uncharacterized protein n=1 Tax=Aliidongia dinghuensis TaxID=1867774 RepID=A0A8J2Z1P2_9PROT|nr:hypothetical protein GCM10011611_66350 [Aliidongia dinghuensis]